ncbi:MAG: permease [Candidatus Dormibacteria bacterium]
MTQLLHSIAASLAMGFFMFWETLWPLVFGFALSGAVQSFVSRSEMRRVMGDHSARSTLNASFFGAVSSSCSYAASAMAKSLFQKGADFTTAMVFMIASTNLVLELGLVLWILIGWQFALSEYIGGAIMIALLAGLSRFFLTPRLVEAARERLQAGERGERGHQGHGTMADAAPEESLRKRIRSKAGWADAAGYMMADLAMLRKEIVIGYVVAGFLAVMVPDSLWRVVFYEGHGTWTSIENVIVGPIIAILSFVCSIGNVPLAAALWKGGISFGGVIAFIFADLITMPLILIYRKFYGWRLTLRLVGLMWLVMSTAGLITEYLFKGLNLVPANYHHTHVAHARLAWDYTTFLNLGFLVVFAGLYWLYRNRERFGGGQGYAIDPVCGMQVETAMAPATARVDGIAHYFCSDRCRDRFVVNPARFTGPGAGPTGMDKVLAAPEVLGVGSGIDPVCGMTVEPRDAAAQRFRAGAKILFCSAGCAQAFDADPRRYFEGAVPAGHGSL